MSVDAFITWFCQEISSKSEASLMIASVLSPLASQNTFKFTPITTNKDRLASKQYSVFVIYILLCLK